MDRGFRRGFTTAEKTELWDRWQRGEFAKAIGRAFASRHRRDLFPVSRRTVEFVRPLGVASRLALTPSEREEISRGIAVHRSEDRWLGCWAARPRR